MQGIRLCQGQWWVSDTLEVATPGPDETLVSVRFAGICGTDLALAAGYYAFDGIPGHEFVGVAETGPLQGRRVVADINLSCGRCDVCLSGQTKHCPSRQVLGIKQAAGVFAEQVCIPTANLFEVPDGLSDELAVLAEPVAAALEVLAEMPKPKPASATVIGAGRLGLLAAHVLAAAGCKVKLLVRNQTRALHVQNRDIEIVTHIKPSSESWVVDCSGSVSGLNAALAALSPRGTLVLKSTLQEAVGIDFSPVMVKELTVQGSRCGKLDQALIWLASGHLTEPEMVSFGFSDIERALAAALDPRFFKVLLRPNRV